MVDGGPIYRALILYPLPKQILPTITFLDYEVADDSNDGGKTIWSIFKTVLTERMPRTFFGMIAD